MAKGKGTGKPPRNSARSLRSALVVVNAKAGTVRSRGPDAVKALVQEKLSPHYSPLDVVLADGDVLPDVRKARDGKTHDVIIAGGGDGTITSVASELLESGVVMGVLPLGTMNFFVQALGFSPVLETALDQLGASLERKVDVGVANERIFLHQVSFGLQPRMGRIREKIGYSSRLTKMLAGVRAFLLLAARPKLVRVIVDADGEVRRVKSPLLVISNNPLEGGEKPTLPASLEDGVVGIYALGPLSFGRVFRLGLDYLANRVVKNPAVEARTAGKVTVARTGWRQRRKISKGLLVTMDGEVMVLENPVTITIKPKSLTVLSPAAAEKPATA